ncbi:hypothetical protein P280DRAFT_473783 [Massarina eburnea CBS 473.64]|uniref:Uncharacterized protein n=1 Tax=Massarina eburnea CBS 473.64 TaxID=1395130 RepID=A0A6A6RK29_9PLEO|nr:hypothetical protein P280DRAFT_473783 [Massarina eburnea CBS 473.64]
MDNRDPIVGDPRPRTSFFGFNAMTSLCELLGTAIYLVVYIGVGLFTITYLTSHFSNTNMPTTRVPTNVNPPPHHKWKSSHSESLAVSLPWANDLRKHLDHLDQDITQHNSELWAPRYRNGGITLSQVPNKASESDSVLAVATAAQRVSGAIMMFGDAWISYETDTGGENEATWSKVHTWEQEPEMAICNLCSHTRSQLNSSVYPAVRELEMEFQGLVEATRDTGRLADHWFTPTAPSSVIDAVFHSWGMFNDLPPYLRVNPTDSEAMYQFISYAQKIRLECDNIRNRDLERFHVLAYSIDNYFYGIQSTLNCSGVGLPAEYDNRAVAVGVTKAGSNIDILIKHLDFWGVRLKLMGRFKI